MVTRSRVHGLYRNTSTVGVDFWQSAQRRPPSNKQNRPSEIIFKSTVSVHKTYESIRVTGKEEEED